MGPPLSRAHFRVFFAQEEVGIAAISPLHWIDADHPPEELGQTVTLRRAASTDRTFYDWRAAAETRKSAARDLTIVLLDEPDGRPVNIWVLRGAVPIRWTGPSLDALSGGIAHEELEVRYQSVDWRTRV